MIWDQFKPGQKVMVETTGQLKATFDAEIESITDETVWLIVPSIMRQGFYKRSIVNMTRIPDLVRTVEDYQALPDRTIIELVSMKMTGTHWDNEFGFGDLFRMGATDKGKHLVGGAFLHSYSIEELVNRDVVMRVVELGGEQQ